MAQRPVNNNNGGENSFYTIPTFVKDADDLAEYINATGPMFNILKSLFGMNECRHEGTSPMRDVKKIVHYGIRQILALRRKDEPDISSAVVLAELYTEMSEEKRKKFMSIIRKK